MRRRPGRCCPGAGAEGGSGGAVPEAFATLRRRVRGQNHTRGQGARRRPARHPQREAPASPGADPRRALRQGEQGVRRRRARAADRADRALRPQRDRRRRDRGPEDAAPRRAQGLPAAPDPRHDHARRLPRGAARPADPGDGRSSTSSASRPARRSAASSSRSRASSTSRRCRRTIPEYIEVDISSLELGDSLRLQDVAAVAGVTFLDDPAETVIANCSSPRGLTEAEEAADEALAAEASAESAAAADADADDDAAPDEE